MRRLNARQKRWIERTVANDRSYKVILYNRFFIFLLAVLAQLVILGITAYSLVYNSALALILQAVLFAVEIVVVLYILNKHDRPSTRLNWIILILIVPVFGVPMYILNGRGVPTRKMQQKIHRAQEENCAGIERVYGKAEPFIPQTRGEAVSKFLDTCAKYPAFQRGDITYYESGERIFPVILEELKKANQYILLEYFIIAHGKMWNEILQILLEKAEAGVQIRIIYDDFGCMMTLPPKYDIYLETLHENIKCLTFNEVVPFFAVRMNNRDHRKILVIDGKVAFTGGFNLADEYIGEKRRFGYWKDTGLKITGDAVRSFTQMFFYLWNAFRKDKEPIERYLPKIENDGGRYATNFCIHPYDDSPLDGMSIGEAVYTDIIDRAKTYVYIFTPYLILDDFMRASLCRAALRGVDVRIVTPAIPDKKTIFRLTRANYGVLLRAGVKIYEYTPGFIHAKSMVSDDECAVVGTINLDYRSLYHHFENAVYFSGCKAVEDVKKDAEQVFAASKLCTCENTKRGFFGKIIDSALRVFETLL
ncbi:MAG: cardiolipin synthase [Clostridia bacterium]|nr:cardiolipin synthase [Clostridia bacterium]